jgi:hypothetical protein
MRDRKIFRDIRGRHAVVDMLKFKEFGTVANPRT